MLKRHLTIAFEALLNDASKRKRISFFLTPFSFIFGSLLSLRHFFYKTGLFKSYKAEIPVVCVGSIFVGGSGKTPFVRLILKHLSKQAFVLSRGYKAMDEPLFFQNCVVEKNRVKGAKDCFEKGAKVIIMDDGLQHLRLKKDVKVAVLSQEQLEKGWNLLPRGSLRDLPQVLEDVEYVVLHEVDTFEEYSNAKSFLKSYKKPFFIGTKSAFLGFFTMDGHPVENVKKALLMSGISRPHRFEKVVKEQGVEVIDHFLFEDHGKLTFEELEALLRRAEAQNAYLVMTEKDAVKYPYFDEVLQAKIETKIVYDEQNFSNLIGRINEAMD
ncbi:MAG: tetraacyldisaccharide 4'-kinase [Chlamydiae bacterium]|nr:tetraacyldisaccharide 4'-kinase [Chlamydiota bacterium]